MQGATYFFATDLHDEGQDVVLDNVQWRAGLHGATMACAYHYARDVFPYNPVRKVRVLEGGAGPFRPDARPSVAARIRLPVSRLAAETDVLAELPPAADRRGLAVHAWAVYVHNTTRGSRYEDCTIQNVFGDPYIISLCPVYPVVRA